MSVHDKGGGGPKMCGTLLSLLAKVLRIVTFSVRKLLRTLSDTKPVEPQFRGLDIIQGSRIRLVRGLVNFVPALA